ncbi:ribonuclease H protein, partial [Trifolium medium]|nr:ribonuclease H protein [Trifolium medium]
IVRYYKPKFGCYTLNVDGGYRSFQKTGAIGGIVRNHDGDLIMGFYKFFQKAEGPFYMECAAMISGLEKVVILGLNNIELISDSKHIVSSLNKETPGIGKHSETYQEILSFKDKLTNLEFKEVRRCANKAADRLVQIAYNNKEELYFEGSFPEDDVILSDILKEEREI